MIDFSNQFWPKMRNSMCVLIACMACMLADVSGSQESKLEEKREQVSAEVEQLQVDLRLSAFRKDKLTAEIAALEKDRETINREMLASSRKERELEKQIVRAEQRLVQLGVEQDQVRISLKGRRALLAEVLAALQRMGRKPPPALLVTPEDALSSVRSAILLGAVVPEVRSEAEVLLIELKELVRITEGIKNNREKLKANLSSLVEEEQRLSLLLAEKRKLSSAARTNLAEETAKAVALAARADNLNSLIVDLEREIEGAKQAAEQARLAEEEQRKLEEDQIAAVRESAKNQQFGDVNRLSPAISFEDAKGLLPHPVAGVELVGFGEDEGAGEASSGIYIATRAGSRVISPLDGWIVYAGPFRSYGQLLIINAGNGYHIVLAGLEKIDVQPGQFVLVGEPIGLMGTKQVASAGLVDVSSTRPILYVEFRKDGQSIDSAPWWSDKNVKRVSNDT